MTDDGGSDAELDDATLEFAHRMFDLARAGDRQLVELVGAGLPVNLTDPRGNTLLMLAAYHGHAGLVADLAARGADVERINDRGQTPLAAAVFKGALAWSRCCSPPRPIPTPVSPRPWRPRASSSGTTWSSAWSDRRPPTPDGSQVSSSVAGLAFF